MEKEAKFKNGLNKLCRISETYLLLCAFHKNKYLEKHRLLEKLDLNTKGWLDFPKGYVVCHKKRLAWFSATLRIQAFLTFTGSRFRDVAGRGLRGRPQTSLF